MTTPGRGPSSTARTAVWLGVAGVAAAIVFFPLFTAGMCADSSVPGESYCTSWQQSLVGLETTTWLWLGATAVLCGLAWLLTRPRRRRAEGE